MAQVRSTLSSATGASTSRLRVVLLVVLSAACAACAGMPATAMAGTLDQQQTDVGSSFIAINAGMAESDAQTFTAGISGMLDEVDLFLRTDGGTPPDPLTVEIRDSSAGFPGNTVLASHSVPATDVASVGAFVPVHFDPTAPVTAGTQYAIVAYTASPGPGYAWADASSNPYAGGMLFYVTSSPPSGSWNAIPSDDNAFKTYVAPTSPPTSTAPTGQRAAALAKCKKRAHKHRWSHKRLRKCKRQARLLPL